MPGKNTSYRVHCWKQLLSLTRLPAKKKKTQAHLRDGVASIIIILLDNIDLVILDNIDLAVMILRDIR